MRTALRAGLCLITAYAAPELIRLSADLAVERSARAILDNAPGVRAERVTSRGGTIRIEGFGAAGPGWRLDADRITLPRRGSAAPSLVTSALARPAEAAADNVVLVLGDTKVVIPHVEARGTDLTSQDLAALLDTTSSVTLAERLAKLTAAQVSAPTVVIGSSRIADPATGDHLSLTGVSLTDVGAGRVGVLAIAGARFSSPPPGGSQPTRAPSVPFETGRIAIDGLDLPLALDMATGSRPEASTALRAVLRSVSVSGVVLRPDATKKVQVGTVLVGALRGRPLTLPPGDVLSLYDKPASSRTPADRQILSDVLADAAGSAALDHFELRDIVATDAGDGHGSFRMGRAALDGWELLKLGSLAIEDVSVGEPSTDVSLGRFVLSGYDGSGLVDLLKRRMTEGPDVPLPQVIPNRTSLALTDLHIAVPISAEGTGTPDPVKRVVIDVPVARIAGSRDAGTGAVASQASVEMSCDVSAGAADPSYRDLNQFGLSRLDLGAGYSSSFDPATKQISLDRLSFDARDLGRIAVSALLGNASLDMFQAGQGTDEALQAAQNLVFQDFSLVFVNSGVVEKVLPPLAAAAKVSVPLFKAQLKAQAEISVNQVLGATPAAARIVAALRTFVDTPKNLALIVKAPAGLSVATAASTDDPKTLLNVVDIQVLANR